MQTANELYEKVAMIVYVSRDKIIGGRECGAIVEVWKVKPDIEKSLGYDYIEYVTHGHIEDDMLFSLCIKDFKKHYGFTPRKGTCIKMSLNMEKIKQE